MIVDCHPTSDLFTLPASQRPTRHEEMLQHVSGLDDPEKVTEGMPLLANLVDLQAITNEVVTQQVLSSVIDFNGKLCSQQPLVDFVGDLARDSKITIHPDGRVEFTGSRTEMKDLLSIVAEFYLLRNSTNWRAQSLLVPHFNWYDIF